jgi:hypothetical protein
MAFILGKLLDRQSKKLFLQGDRHNVLTYQPQVMRIKLEVCSVTGAEATIEEAGREAV